jgi:tRNA nucleotidyltransferase/poly(A) polymerase
VRDLLLARNVYDWDFAVDGKARSLARKVANALQGAYYTLDAERDAGRVVLEDPTTRRPTSLDFAHLRADTIEEDLYLRDFTINAMALTLNGDLIDPTNGRQDLRARQIRQTSAASFKNDPARLLRAVRQAGQLAFDIEATTCNAIRRQASRITETSPERIRDELLKILRLAQSPTSLQKLADLGLLPHVLPVLSEMRHQVNGAWHHTLSVLGLQNAILDFLRDQPSSQAPQVPDWVWEPLTRTLAPFQAALCDYLTAIAVAQLTRIDLLRWGALFHETGKASPSPKTERSASGQDWETTGEAITRHHLKTLRFPNKAMTFIETLVKTHARPIQLSKTPLTRRSIYQFYRDTDEAGVASVLLALADTMGSREFPLKPGSWETLLNTSAAMLAAYFQRRDEIVAPTLLLNGHDLLSMGIRRGPKIGHLLEALREAQAAGEIHTQDEAMAFIQTHINVPNG